VTNTRSLETSENQLIQSDVGKSPNKNAISVVDSLVQELKGRNQSKNAQMLHRNGIPVNMDQTRALFLNQ